MNAVILANGEFPSHPIPLKALREARTVYCCDGAVHKYMRFAQSGEAPHGPQEVHVVGDCDSIGDPTLFPIPFTLFPVKEQDYNDLTKTVRYALSRGERALTIVGATGLREDHTLGNISLLSYYLREFGVAITMLTDYGRFTPIRETTRFDSYPRQQVSLFSLRNDTPLTTHGLEYPLRRGTLPQWWMGTLNSALGEAFTIETEGEAELIVYQTYEAKS